MRTLLLALTLLVATACRAEDTAPSQAPATTATATAVFAGGCFWCLEQPFDELDGVLSTTSGYTGGRVANPTYEQVSAGDTGHVEAVEVVYDPERVDYERLLAVFWRNIDPLDDGGQFCDRGSPYRSAIFVRDTDKRRLAEASLEEIRERLGQPLATPIRDAAPFYAAEDYHQDYYRKNPLRYRYYRAGCGRDARLEQLWGPDAKH